MRTSCKSMTRAVISAFMLRWPLIQLETVPEPTQRKRANGRAPKALASLWSKGLTSRSASGFFGMLMLSMVRVRPRHFSSCPPV